jgi:hypothetical protein
LLVGWILSVAAGSRVWREERCCLIFLGIVLKVCILKRVLRDVRLERICGRRGGKSGMGYGGSDVRVG